LTSPFEDSSDIATSIMEDASISVDRLQVSQPSSDGDMPEFDADRFIFNFLSLDVFKFDVVWSMCDGLGSSDCRVDARQPRRNNFEIHRNA
jgi:hypothetical protein